MGDLQRKMFQKKLRDAETALGFDFSEEAEENATPQNTVTQTDQTVLQTSSNEQDL